MKEITVTEKGKAVLKGVLAAAIVFVTGFCVIFAFWIMGEYNPALLGLFDYRAATWGDGICLPLLVGALVTYTSLHQEREKRQKRAEIIMGAVFGLLAAAIQAKWLLSDSTRLNWTIPRHYYFNAPGWYHALFFVGMFAALGVLFTRLFYVKRTELQERKNRFEQSEYKCVQVDGFQMIVQTVIWFAGAFFLFLLALDDCATKYNYFQPLIILLALLLIAVGGFCTAIFVTVKSVSIQEYKKLAKAEIAPILSGLFSAFSLANIMYGGIHTRVAYVVACALLLVVLIVPNSEKKGQMILFYFLAAIPTILLECAISSQIRLENSYVIFVLAVFVACAIAACQEDTTEICVLRKGMMAATVIIVCISALILLFINVDSLETESLYESIIGFIFTLAVPAYVKQTFRCLVATEKRSGKEAVEKTQKLLYPLYIIVMAGGLILLISVFFPNTRGFVREKIINYTILLAGSVCLLISVMVLLLQWWKRNKQEAANRGVGIIALTLAYTSLFAIICSFDFWQKLQFSDFAGSNFLVVPAMLVYSCAVVSGFINNLCRLRDNKPDWATYLSAFIIFCGAQINMTISTLQMICYRTILSLFVNLLVITFSGAVLPLLIGSVILQKRRKPQLTLNEPLFGVFQDGLMYGLAIFVIELFSVYLVPTISFSEMTPFSIIEFLAALVTFLTLVSWLLKFCISNNLPHYQNMKQRKETEFPNVSAEDQQSLEYQLMSLKEYLTFQNIAAFLMTLPYSVFTIIVIIVEFVMSDEKGWDKLGHKFFPGYEPKISPPPIIPKNDHNGA